MGFIHQSQTLPICSAATEASLLIKIAFNGPKLRYINTALRSALHL